MKEDALLWEKLEDGRVHCFLCAHECRIPSSKFGICGVRQNVNGGLITFAYGELIASNIDPVEKKPLYHFLPGTLTFSVATIGCNFRCGFCQNWQISQMRYKDGIDVEGHRASPGQIVAAAEQNKCKSISYTYTEPTIFFEYALDTARLAREKGLRNVFVTNGFMTTQALDAIHPNLDACNVDLKFFHDEKYRSICGGRLEPVLNAIRKMKERGIWVEVTTLLIPGENDDDAQVEGIASFLAGVDVGMPWHLSRFHPDYQFTDRQATSQDSLERAMQIGQSHGLRHIYLGNVSKETDTCCPNCGKSLISRKGFSVVANSVRNGRCPACNAPVAGIWE